MTLGRITDSPNFNSLTHGGAELSHETTSIRLKRDVVQPEDLRPSARQRERPTCTITREQRLVIFGMLFSNDLLRHDESSRRCGLRQSLGHLQPNELIVTVSLKLGQ